MAGNPLSGSAIARPSPQPAEAAKARFRLATSFGLITVGALAALAVIPSQAAAQVQPGCTSTLPAPYSPFSQIVGGVTGAANSITSVIGTMNTAFQAQGDAFVVGLPNAKPDQIAGGTWGRMIGGRVDNQATGTFSGAISPGTTGFSSGFPGGPGAAGTINCHTNIRQDYAGFQLGQDLARLNLSGSGATLHVGVTGGYAEASAQDLGGSTFTGGFQVPFVGLYAAYTSGNFFADAVLRSDFYQMNLTAAPAALGNQRLDAFGLTGTVSAGYKIDIGNNWFIQPSVSGIHSNTKVDTLNLPGGYGNTFNPLYLPPGTVQFSNIQSWLGRVGVQVGTTFTDGKVVWEPFATASVWHEFAGNVSASYSAPEFYAASAPLHPFAPCAVIPIPYPNGCGNAVSGTLSGTRVGTYGQYSVGVFGLMSGTPWLGYLRLDYKQGANIEAFGFNAGLRYQFDPTQQIAPGALYDGPARAAAYDWTGFYVGGFVGSAWGRTNWSFPQTATTANPSIAGVTGGGTLGFNKQFDRFVVGIEGDVAFTNASGGQSCQDGVNNFNIIQNCNNNVHVLATAAARVGYTWLDRVLLFGKIGGAWTSNSLDAACNGDSQFFSGGCFPTNNPFGTVQNLTMKDPRFGAVVGAGVEYALSPAWSAKLEYNYIDFGTKSFVLTDTTPVTVREYFNQIKFGLNYHFNADDPASDAVVAAAMPVKALPLKAPPASPNAYDWTGAYTGLMGAYRMSDAQWNTAALPVSAAVAAFVAPFFGFLPPTPDPTTNPAKFFNAAAQGGLFAGYDWQVARRWVTGIEGDVAFGDSSMRRAGIPGTFGNGAAAAIFLLPGIEALQADSSTVKFGWDGSIRGRVGYLASPTVLVYGTGGVAFQQMSVGANCNGGVASWCASVVRFFFPGVIGPPRSETASTVRTGWTAGGGLEGVLTGNWLGKVEFRYSDFGRYSHNFFAGTIDEVDMTLRPHTYTFLAGIGYKFHGNGSLIAQ
jgi:opacity protein-like surface antigen